MISHAVHQGERPQIEQLVGKKIRTKSPTDSHLLRSHRGQPKRGLKKRRAACAPA